MKTTCGRALRPLLPLLCALATSATPGVAQVAVSAAAGASSFDLSGLGTSGVAGVRAEVGVASALTAQIGTAFFWYGTQGDDETAMLLPEAGVLWRVPLPIPFYLGAGAGHSVVVKGGSTSDPTLFAAVGLEFEDRGGWAIRPELRVRAVDPWAGTMADVTLGVRRRIGG